MGSGLRVQGVGRGQLAGRGRFEVRVLTNLYLSSYRTVKALQRVFSFFEPYEVLQQVPERIS